MQIKIEITDSKLLGIDSREMTFDSSDFPQGKFNYEEIALLDLGEEYLSRLLKYAESEHKNLVENFIEDEVDDHDCKDEKCTDESHPKI